MATRAATEAAAGRTPWSRFGWLMAVVWMVFLVYPLLALLDSDAGAGWRVLGWIGLIGFAVFYVIGFIVGMRGDWGAPRPIVIVLFGVILVCAAATIPAVRTQALSFLPFLMSYASYGLRGAWHWATTVAAVVLAVTVLLVTGRVEGHLQILVAILIVAVVNSLQIWFIGRSAEAEKARVQLAAADERASVARDVHDMLGHALTAVKLKAELARRMVDRDPARAKAELDQIVALATEAIADVRSTVTGLTSTGLADQIAASAAVLDSAGLAVHVDGRPDALTPAQSLPAAWILREATTNVLRHAGASGVRIEIAPGVLSVEDDGGGIRGAAGSGMRGMAERAAAAGATLRVDGLPAGGTRVSVIW